MERSDTTALSSYVLVNDTLLVNESSPTAENGALYQSSAGNTKQIPLLINISNGIYLRLIVVQSDVLCGLCSHRAVFQRTYWKWFSIFWNSTVVRFIKSKNSVDFLFTVKTNSLTPEKFFHASSCLITSYKDKKNGKTLDTGYFLYCFLFLRLV